MSSIIFAYDCRETGCWYRYDDEVHLTLNLTYPNEGRDQHLVNKKKQIEKTVCGLEKPVSRQSVKHYEEDSVTKCELCNRVMLLEELKE